MIEKSTTMQKTFILWDRKDGERPPRDQDGEINTTGILGKLTEDNIYLTAYAQYPEGKTHKSMDVGQRIPNVVFTLSGGHGAYDLYRLT